MSGEVVDSLFLGKDKGMTIVVSKLTEAIQWKKITSDTLGLTGVVLWCFINIGFRHYKKHLQMCIVALSEGRVSPITQITASVKMTTKMIVVKDTRLMVMSWSHDPLCEAPTNVACEVTKKNMTCHQIYWVLNENSITVLVKRCLLHSTMNTSVK